MSTAAPHEWSLRRRLLLLFAATTLGLWLLSATGMYFITVREGSTLLDRSLGETATLLTQLAEHEFLEHGPELGAELMQLETHAPRNALQFQLFDGPTEAYGSGGAVGQPLLPRSVQGYAWTTVRGARWRAFATWNTAHTLQVQIAAPLTLRDEFSFQVLTRIALLLSVLLPLSMGLTWFILRRSFEPLSACAHDIAWRAPEDLNEVERHHAPAEVGPLLDALDRLLGRVRNTLRTERRFTADAAHELRSPLAAIRASAQVLCQLRHTADRDLIAANLVSAVDRGSRLIDQLLTLARVDATAQGQDWSEVDLLDVLESQIEEHASAADDRQLRLTLQGVPLCLSGNRQLLEVLTRNLLDNAIRYSPAGGTIIVSLDVNGGAGELRICDEGPGIPVAQRQRVFDRFHRLMTTAASGCGLGLSIVSRVAALHGAAVEILEGPGGRGTEVLVSFAAVHVPAPDPSVAAAG
jgi:two-component system, OmpR family, sensor histidine kinase QseC